MRLTSRTLFLGICAAGLGLFAAGALSFAWIRRGPGMGGTEAASEAVSIPGTEPGALNAGSLSSTKTASAPNVSAFEPDESEVLRGRYVYERNCMICHGRWGDGKGELAAGMSPKPRRLTSGIFKFRSTPTGSLPTDQDLLRTIRRGIASSSMPSFAALPERDLVSVIVYVKTLSSRWRAAANYAEPVAVPTEPGWLQGGDSFDSHRLAGAALFAVNCQPCHGGQAPELRDFWEELCPPPSLDSAGLKCGPELVDVYRTLVTGLDGTPMPSFRDALSEEQLWDLVAYIGWRRALGGGGGESAVGK